MKINPKKLRMDGGTQSRESINQDLVEEYADAMRSGGIFPPADVFFDGLNYWVADGFHRTLAAIAAEVKKVDVVVHMGTVRDAILFSVGANAGHGLRRSNADKRRSVETLLKDEEWGQWSNEQIAKRCGVDPQTVANHRPISRNSGHSEPVKAIRNGKEYTVNTTNIGKRSGGVQEPTPDNSGESAPSSVSAVAVVGVPAGFEGDEPEPIGPLTDAEWLDTLPLKAKLSGRPLEVFTAGALTYKQITESDHYRKFLSDAKRATSAHRQDNVQCEYLSKLYWFTATKHPRSWLLCSVCNGAGCDTCKRRGYAIG